MYAEQTIMSSFSELSLGGRKQPMFLWPSTFGPLRKIPSASSSWTCFVEMSRTVRWFAIWDSVTLAVKAFL